MPWKGAPPPFYPASGYTAKDRCKLSEMLPSQLYLTNCKGAMDLDALTKLEVSHIASVGDEFVEKTKVEGIEYWCKDITDDDHAAASMAAALREAAGFIHSAIAGGGCVVVHCAAGISRSACVVLGYYVVHRGQTLREAFAHVFKCRPCIWPNEGAPRPPALSGRRLCLLSCVAPAPRTPPPRAQASCRRCPTSSTR